MSAYIIFFGSLSSFFGSSFVLGTRVILDSLNIINFENNLRIFKYKKEAIITCTATFILGIYFTFRPSEKNNITWGSGGAWSTGPETDSRITPGLITTLAFSLLIFLGIGCYGLSYTSIESSIID